MDEVYDFVTANGIPFRALIDRDIPGKPVVKFFDQRYDFTPDGQFVSSYYVSTLVGNGYDPLSNSGLCLDGGIPNWTIDARSFRTVAHWLIEMVG
jgi:hypothetical protein